MNITHRITLFAALLAVATAASAAEVTLPAINSNEGTEAEQVQSSALREASKKLLKASSPTFGKGNRAVVRVETTSEGHSSYCLVLMTKLMVPGTDKGTWVPEKTECK